MSEISLYRYRLRYTKGPSLRFIGHLDLLRTWERALRRAKIPMAYTEGFHPHQRINMGLALPLGFSSDCELIDLWLEQETDPNILMSKISKALPTGLKLHAIESVILSSPSLQERIRWAEYNVSFEPEGSVEEVEAVVDDLLAMGTLQRERRGKSYDLRPLVEGIEVRRHNDDVTLEMKLSASQEGTGRPDEVLKVLGYKPEAAQIIRTRLILAEE